MNDAIEAGARADLLPCPFCGGSDLVLDKNGYKTKWVICDGCGATIDDNPHGDCVDLWNTRAIASGALVPASAVAEMRERWTQALRDLRELVLVGGTTEEIQDRCFDLIMCGPAGLAPASGDYVVVPVEPTREQLDALSVACRETWGVNVERKRPMPFYTAEWRERMKPIYRAALLNAASRTGGGE